MAIDFSKIRALTAGEIVRALLADGFYWRKGRGGSTSIRTAVESR